MQASHSRSNAADDITPPQFLYPLINGFNPSPMANYDGFPGGVNLSTENHPPLQMLDYSRSFDDSPALGLSLDSTSNARSSDVAQRHQRNEAEQKRREELRQAFEHLKSTLPVTKQKSSKQSLLNQAVAYMHQLEENTRLLQRRLDKIEDELNSQRSINEGLIRAMTQ